ncbi:YceD family protein [Roseomonas elaeocarpi]|uniref:DUF177 domain-containing protein n=1 Tax=Roseomonas elaeocarpi TaxID=907779 RepID=A0ABV6JXI7_9PROT
MNNELSRPIVLAHIPAAGRQERVEASPAEREALARRFELLALDSLQAEVTIKPTIDGGFSVVGRMRAEVVQACVVTLEPVPQHIDEAVNWQVVQAAAGEEEEPGEEDDLDGPDQVEVSDGVLDLGEEIAQQLSLALDPYPRAPGAGLGEEGVGDGPFNPFAVLRTVQRKS